MAPAIKLPAANIAKIARIMRIDGRNLHDRRGAVKTCVVCHRRWAVIEVGVLNPLESVVGLCANVLVYDAL